LANTAQARKRARQAEKHRQRNAGARSEMRTELKKVITAIDAGDKTAAEDALKSAVPMMDKLAGKGLMHKNKAARHKSRLNAKIRTL
jgi:small subunit ribosomal protein S20